MATFKKEKSEHAKFIEDWTGKIWVLEGQQYDESNKDKYLFVKDFTGRKLALDIDACGTYESTVAQIAKHFEEPNTSIPWLHDQILQGEFLFLMDTVEEDALIIESSNWHNHTGKGQLIEMIATPPGRKDKHLWGIHVNRKQMLFHRRDNCLTEYPKGWEDKP